MRNEKLIAAREERGWTQEKAAEKIGVGRVTYARWEAKGVIPHLSTSSLACEAFKMTAEKLGFRKPVKTQEIESQEDVNRRKAIQEIGKFVGATSAFFVLPQTLLNADELERLIRTLTKPSSIDKETLCGLKSTTGNYWRLRVHGGIASPNLLDAVLGLYRIAEQLLQSSLLPTSRTLLCAVTSEIALLAGMLLSTDMHKHDEAQFYYNMALVLAQQANNDALYAACLGRISSLAATIGKPKEARSLLQEAQRLVTLSNAFTLRSWLAAEEAEVQADISAQENIQNPGACFKALEKAEIFAAQIHSEEDTFGMYFDLSRISAYRGSCNIRLDHPVEALEVLKEALEALEPLEPSGALTRAVLLDLAEASIQATAVEQACNYIKQALEVIIQMQTASSLQRVYKLRQQLKPWSMAQDVKDLDEQLRGFNSGLI
jgi:DNA-binding XRE family transcriptional regulator